MISLLKLHPARFVLFSLFCFQLASASGRIEFTTTNGDSVKGEVIGVYNGIVYIDTGKGTTFVPFSGLEEASQKPVEAWFVDYIESLQAGPVLVNESDSRLTQFLDGNLLVWRDGELVDYDFASQPEPEFYAFYYSAHWCGPCRRFTPKLKAFYNGMKRLGHDNFEIVFVSSDTSKGMMKKYMQEDEMPWPAVKYNKKGSGIVSRYKGSGIPCLVVTDRYGNLLAHSYRGDEYLGPSEPKDHLENMLQYTAALKEKVLAGGE